MILGGIHIFISDIFMDRFGDGAAADERLDFLPDRQIRPFYQSADDIVRAGVGPVGLWKGISVFSAGGYIVYDTPWIINFRIPETISIVPLPHCFRIFRESIEIQHLIDFLLGKAKILRIGIIGDGHDFEVIQSCKNGFSADAQTAGNHSKSHIFVCFESGLKQGTYRKEDIIIESVKPGVF